MRLTTMFIFGTAVGLFLGISCADIAYSFRYDRTHHMCKDSKGYEAYVALKGDMEYCFKQHRETNKIIKQNLVVE